jgi:hypothetical protein
VLPYSECDAECSGRLVVRPVTQVLSQITVKAPVKFAVDDGDCQGCRVLATAVVRGEHTGNRTRVLQRRRQIQRRRRTDRGGSFFDSKTRSPPSSGFPCCSLHCCPLPLGALRSLTSTRVRIGVSDVGFDDFVFVVRAATRTIPTRSRARSTSRGLIHPGREVTHDRSHRSFVHCS